MLHKREEGTMAKKVREITVVTPNKVGMLAKVSGVLAAGRVNMAALSAYGAGAKAYFRIVANDTKKAMRVLKAAKLRFSEKDIVAVTLKNKVGQAEALAKKLARTGVNISYCYGSTGPGSSTLFLFATKNLKKALSALR